MCAWKTKCLLHLITYEHARTRQDDTTLSIYVAKDYLKATIISGHKFCGLLYLAGIHFSVF